MPEGLPRNHNQYLRQNLWMQKNVGFDEDLTLYDPLWIAFLSKIRSFSAKLPSFLKLAKVLIMAIDVFWDDDAQTTIRYKFGEEWALQDLLAATQADDALMDMVDHTVHLIFDMTDTKALPAGLVSSMRALETEISDQLGLIVLVGATTFFESLSNIFYNIFATGKKGLAAFKTATTLDEARQLIAAYEAEV